MSSKLNNVRHDGFSEFLPEAMAFLKHQIAGHSHTGKQQMGMLKHQEGYVLKPLQLDEKGIKEHGFYESLNATSLQVKLLKNFVPKYLGTLDVDFPFGTRKFLKLEDLVDGHQNPCIADIKIGRHTWDPDATEEKRAKEEKKYRGTREAYGFCIPGMKFYNAETKKIVSYDRSYGLQLDKTSAVSAISAFLNSSQPKSRTVIGAFLQKLEELRNWFEEQREYLFFATSLLFVYSANKIVPLEDYGHQNNNNGELEVEAGPNAVNNPLIHVKGEVHHDREIVTLKLIDFAHVFAADGKRDDSFIFGLTSLIEIFRSLLENKAD